MKLVLLPPLVLLLVGCHSRDSSAHQDAEVRDADVIDADARSESPDAADASTSAYPPEDKVRAIFKRRIHGDCPDSAPIGDYWLRGVATASFDLDTWLEAHHARFPRDKSCPSGGPEQDQCICDRELLLPGRDTPLLRCRREMVAAHDDRYTKTILYALEGNTLRVVFEQTTGTADNFQMLIPVLDFVPRIRNDALVFEETYCRGCPVAMEYFAAASDPGLKEARVAYKGICSLDSWEWKWSGRQLKKYRRTTPAPPVSTSSSAN
ncbi:MAG: hypothetical protein FWD69_05315 [Polyangiaceae bacterium]|nr:hypothetical protein [Polyangiaceae bacterium]